jgi:hypothetical protein
MEVRWTRHGPSIRFVANSSAGIEIRYSKKLGAISIILKFTIVQTSHKDLSSLFGMCEHTLVVIPMH